MAGPRVVVPALPGPARLVRAGSARSPAEANAVAAFDLRGPVDADRLLGVAAALGVRHEGLRSTFHRRGDRVVVRIEPGLVPEVVREDGPDLEVDGWVQRFGARPFALKRGPNWRIGLLRRGPEHHVLAFAAHHALIDEWSVRLVVADVSAAYVAPGTPVEAVRGLGTAEGLVAVTRRRLADARPEGVAVAAEVARLGDLEPTPVPPDLLGDAEGHRRVVAELRPEVVVRARELGRSVGGSVATVALAATASTLAAWSGAAEVALAVTSAGRRGEEWGVIGMFMDHVLVRIGVPVPGALDGALLREAQQALTHAREPVGVPYGAVARAVARRSGTAVADLPAAQFNWVSGDDGLALPGVEVRRRLAPAFAGEAPLLFEGRSTPEGGVRLTLTIGPRHAEAEAAALLAQVVGAVEGVAPVRLEPAHPHDVGAPSVPAPVPGERVLVGSAPTLANAAHLAEVLGDGAVAVVLDDDLPGGARAERLAVLAAAPPVPGDAYVLFTSGSSGTPKAVAVGRDNLAAFLEAIQHRHPLTSEDRVLLHTPLSFDVGLAEALWPLAVGARLVEAGPDAGPAALAGLLGREAITVLWAVPSVLARIVAQAAASRAASLRLVLVIGEPFDPVLAAAAARTWPGATLVNAYGPTECTVAVTTGVVDLAEGRARLPVGRPLRGQWVQVLDALGDPVPVGVLGDVWIAGAGVARGYLDEAATRTAFVDDPRVPGGRRYRSGDRGRRLADGRLDLLGRADDELKVGGLRVRPADVERVLAAHPSVAEAGVVPCTGAGGRRRLAAFVVLHPDAPDVPDAAAGDPASIRAWARTRLAPALVPARIVPVASLPATSSGKLDRSRLAVDVGDQPPTRAPAGPIEETVAEAFATVLGLDAVGADDDLLDLGGDSLAAVEIAERLAEAGLPLSARAVLDAATVAGIAAGLTAG